MLKVRKWQKKTNRNRKGQSVIEFAFVSLLFVSMIVLSFNAIVGFAVSQYFSYVTFLSARALQAGGKNWDDQAQAACKTMRQLLPGLPACDDSAAGFSVTFPILPGKSFAVIDKIYIPPTVVAYGPSRNRGGATTVSENSAQVYIQFRVPFFTVPLSASFAPFQTVSFVAKSALGREVSQEECQAYFQSFYLKWGDPGSDVNSQWGSDFVRKSWKGMEDNGC